MDSLRILSLLLPLLILAAGCAHAIDFGPTGRIEDPEEILEVLRSRYERVSSLSAEGKLGIDSPRGGGTLRMALDVGKPGKLYLETQDILGIARGTFSTDGNAFYFYDPGENVFTTGPATADMMGRFLPVRLPPDELASLLLGQIPLLEGGEAKLEVEPEGMYRLYLRKGGVQQRILVGTRDLRLISVETRGRQGVDAELSGHERLLPDLPFPKSIDLVERRSGTKLRIRYARLELNQEPEEGAFVLQPPPGAIVEDLTEDSWD